MLGNYSYQQSKNDDTYADVGNAPNHQVYFRGQWQLDHNQKLTLQVNRVGEQKRVDGDERSAMSAYTSIDLHWRIKNIISKLDIALTVANALDENIREASPGPTLTTAQAVIPGDYPMAGRSMNVEASYEF
jgi:outer membrane receptor protein involved in Fe transport